MISNICVLCRGLETGGALCDICILQAAEVRSQWRDHKYQSRSQLQYGEVTRAPPVPPQQTTTTTALTQPG